VASRSPRHRQGFGHLCRDTSNACICLSPRLPSSVTMMGQPKCYWVSSQVTFGETLTPLIITPVSSPPIHTPCAKFFPHLYRRHRGSSRSPRYQQGLRSSLSRHLECMYMSSASITIEDDYDGPAQMSLGMQNQQ
jgi:hypothetical protein